MTPYTISIYLDKRRQKKNGKFPLKLQVFTSTPRKQKLYPTKLEYSEDYFEKIWVHGKRLNKEEKTDKLKIQAILIHAEEVASKLNPFTYNQFEKTIVRKTTDATNVVYLYNYVIKRYKARKQVSTASLYELSKKSIETFLTDTKRAKKIDQLSLFDINKDWLLDYEFFMLDEKKRSLTTVSIYLRCLRSIFNKAIDEKDIEREFYPFGGKKYEIPEAQNKKKALTKEELIKLFNLNGATPEQEKAKDFWFLSYSCNGMNIKDLLLLKNKNIKSDKFEFTRAKTRLTSKKKATKITVYLNEYINNMIDKYGNEDKSPENYIFPILSHGINAEEQQKKIKNFTKFINQNLKKLCKNNKLPEDISTYWARHTFATQSIKKGASMEFMRESLGHKDMKTTQNYFAGFDDETKKEFANDLMKF